LGPRTSSAPHHITANSRTHSIAEHHAGLDHLRILRDCDGHVVEDANRRSLLVERHHRRRNLDGGGFNDSLPAGLVAETAEKFAGLVLHDRANLKRWEGAD
jgi:hypothetical protein